MKKESVDARRRNRRVAELRFRRRLASKFASRQKNRIKSNLSFGFVVKTKRKQGVIKDRRYPVKIEAPEYIDIYKPKRHLKTVAFISSVRQAVCVGRAKVSICFRNTRSISAAAGLLFLAEVDRLVKRFGQSRITCTNPPLHRDGYGVEQRTVECVLNQIGFFKLIGKKERCLQSPPNVECWEYATGDIADGTMVGKVLSQVSAKIPPSTSSVLYRGGIEAIANSVEHAYMGLRGDGTGINDKRWWMFAAVFGDELTVIVCDLGVGIPNTIHKTQPPKLLNRIFSKFNILSKGDSSWIKAATLVKETRTEEGHRGKGGTDLRTLLKTERRSSLAIYSNRGFYRVRNSVTSKGSRAVPETWFDHRASIHGTIIEWTIKL